MTPRTPARRPLRACALSLAVAACGAAPAPTGSPATEPAATAAPVTTFYAGTMTVTSADGATPYGPPKPGLVSRTVDAGRDRIVEVVVDDGALRTTTLTRAGAGNTFNATDEAHSFTGTVTMTGEGWQFTGWSYDLAMADGSGKIAGTATIDGTGIHTEKYFIGPDGQKQVRITDALAPISQTEYDTKLAALLKH